MYQFVASLDVAASFVLKSASASPSPAIIDSKSTVPVGSLDLSTLIVEWCEDGPSMISLLEEVGTRLKLTSVYNIY